MVAFRLPIRDFVFCFGRAIMEIIFFYLQAVSVAVFVFTGDPIAFIASVQPIGRYFFSGGQVAYEAAVRLSVQYSFGLASFYRFHGEKSRMDYLFFQSIGHAGFILLLTVVPSEDFFFPDLAVPPAIDFGVGKCIALFQFNFFSR